MAILREDFEPLGYQAVIFTEKAEIRAEKILKWLPSLWVARFPDPTVLGATNLPPEVPRISWQKEKRPWGGSVGPSVFAITWRNYSTPGGEKLSLERFLGKTVPTLLAYKKQFKLEAHRVACLCSRFSRQKNPAKMLAEHFCKPIWMKSPFNRPENFEIHSHKSFDLPGSEKINSWMRIKTAKLLEDMPTTEMAVIAEQDFNTLEEPLERKIKESDITKFFKASPKEIDRVLDLYFPPKNG